MYEETFYTINVCSVARNRVRLIIINTSILMKRNNCIFTIIVKMSMAERKSCKLEEARFLLVQQ